MAAMTDPEADAAAGEPRWLDDGKQAAWRGLLEMHRRLMHALAQDLRRDELSDSDFAVLVGVSEAPCARIRAHELCAGLQWEKSRLSKQITRMEARGLVAREQCEHDARGSFVVLTATGRQVLEHAAPRHVAMVRRLVFDVLSDEQVQQLTTICADITRQVAQIDPPA